MDPETTIDQTISELTGQLRGRTDAPVLLRRLFDGLCEKLSGDLGGDLSADLSIDHISAPNLVVEVLDAESGKLFRRYLELEFEENDNGIRLIGENMAGEPAQIVFLSETALIKMRDLRGHGRDTPRCKEGA